MARGRENLVQIASIIGIPGVGMVIRCMVVAWARPRGYQCGVATIASQCLCVMCADGTQVFVMLVVGEERPAPGRYEHTWTCPIRPQPPPSTWPWCCSSTTTARRRPSRHLSVLRRDSQREGGWCSFVRDSLTFVIVVACEFTQLCGEGIEGGADEALSDRLGGLAAPPHRTHTPPADRDLVIKNLEGSLTRGGVQANP